MNGITPNLWFDDEAEEAAKFYVEVFNNAELGGVTHYGEATKEVSGKAPGSVMTASFTIDGHEFTGINGGPQFQFSEAISFQVNCEDQAEVDELWEKLTADGGEEGPCGWLKDKYGVSWQIVPTAAMNELLQDEDRDRAERAMAAMLKMKKLDVEALRQAAEGAPA